MSYKKSIIAFAFSLLLIFSNTETAFAGYYEQGVQAYAKNNFYLAEYNFQKALVMNPSDLKIRYYLAATLLNENKKNQALYHLKYIVQMSPNSDMGKVAQMSISNMQSKSSVSNNGYNASQNTNRAIIAMNGNDKSSIILNDVKINNQKVGAYVLDTGASYITITRSLASKLNLDTTNCEKIRVTTANGIVSSPLVTLNNVSVNGLMAYNVKAVVQDIGGQDKIEGLMGLSYLNNFKMTLDNSNNRIILEK